MEPTNLIRQSTLKLHTEGAVIVVGCGGVGSWTAYSLALAGVQNLWLFDPDEVSESNLNRLPVPKTVVGMSKSRAIAQLIREHRPDTFVRPLGTFSVSTADALQLSTKVRWIIVTTDTLKSRQMCAAWAKANNVNYIEAAAEGETGSVTGAPAEWATPDEESPGYASVPVWVGPCITAAAMAVAHVLHQTTLGDRTIRQGMGSVANTKRKIYTIYDSGVR